MDSLSDDMWASLAVEEEAKLEGKKTESWTDEEANIHTPATPTDSQILDRPFTPTSTARSTSSSSGSINFNSPCLLTSTPKHIRISNIDSDEETDYPTSTKHDELNRILQAGAHRILGITKQEDDDYPPESVLEEMEKDVEELVRGLEKFDLALPPEQESAVEKWDDDIDWAFEVAVTGRG